MLRVPHPAFEEFERFEKFEKFEVEGSVPRSMFRVSRSELGTEVTS